MSTTGASAEPPPASATPAARKRPGWLTAVAITSIALGGIRIGWASYMLVLPKLLAFQAGLVARAPGNPITDLQRDIFQQMSALTRAFLGGNRGLIIAGTSFCVLLIVGGIGCLKLRARFRRAALVGLVGLILCDGALASAELRYQRDLSDVSGSLMRRTMELTGQTADRGLQTVSSFTESMQNVGYYMMVVWMVLRIALALGCFVYLASAPTKRLFEAGAAS